VAGRPLLIVLLAGLLAAAASAGTAGTRTARFLVSMRATITKQWTYASAARSSGCRTAIAGKGLRTITLRSRDASVVTATWAGGRARVRFGGAARALGGLIRESGTKTTTTTGPAECDPGTQRLTCTPISRSVSDLRAELVSGRRHEVGFRRMKDVVPDAFFGSCPGEPTSVRTVGSGLALADASFSERDLFDRNTGGLTLQGSADASTTLLNRTAKIVEHVRWTATLRRLG
jgi:hypothetical protein